MFVKNPIKTASFLEPQKKKKKETRPPKKPHMPKTSSNFAIFGISDDSRPFFFTKDHATNSLREINLPKGVSLCAEAAAVMKGSDTMIICGGLSNDKKSACTEVLEYKFSTNKFSKLPDMLRGRYRHSIFYMDNTIYVVGGYTFNKGSSIKSDKCETFDFKTRNGSE